MAGRSLCRWASKLKGGRRGGVVEEKREGVMGEGKEKGSGGGEEVKSDFKA